MNLQDAIKLLFEGEFTSDSVRLVLNADINDIIDIAEEFGEETDYIIESALEKAKENACELSDISELVRDRYLFLDAIPNGTAREINVRAAEFLAVMNNGADPISDGNLQKLSVSESWQERLEAAWTIRDRSDKLALSIKQTFSKDSFKDEDGCFIVREGAGFYD